jgi:hypothetical protein
MYGEIEGRKAKGRAFKDVFKVVGPTMGMSLEQLEGVAGGKIKSDMDWANVAETITPYMPSLINATLAQGRIEQAPVIQTQRDNAATDRMYEAERLRRERDAANNPPAPTPITLPNRMRSFRQPGGN